jgi:hypothetical protein
VLYLKCGVLVVVDFKAKLLYTEEIHPIKIWEGNRWKWIRRGFWIDLKGYDLVEYLREPGHVNLDRIFQLLWYLLKSILWYCEYQNFNFREWLDKWKAIRWSDSPNPVTSVLKGFDLCFDMTVIFGFSLSLYFFPHSRC